MNCDLIRIIFDRNKPFHFSYNRDAQVESILELGRAKRISIEFLTEVCHHPDHPRQVRWNEIPIVNIKCFGDWCNFEILNNSQDVIFQLIQPVIQLPKMRYIAILVDIRLPGWNSCQELIIVLNRAGKMLLIPSKIDLTPLDLLKLRKNWSILTRKLVQLKDDLKLLDIIAPRLFPNSNFQIFTQ